MSFTDKDLQLFAKKNISTAQVKEQLNAFETGFPALHINAAASIQKGILKANDAQIDLFLSEWNNYLEHNNTIVKFVPASGAASRMFKDLFEFVENKDNLQNDFIKAFFTNIEKFAFYKELNNICIKEEQRDIKELMRVQAHKTIIRLLLSENGLNYGSLPKGLLLFHSYEHEQRTPALEHLIEGALYAKNKVNKVAIHFTVSSEHKSLFKKHISENVNAYEKKYGVNYNISFSEQKPSTDTIAADADNKPFRDADNQLLFRPGGHGALIENLNDINADVIFVKNIDNVVPDHFKNVTVTYKKLIAGILVHLQTKAFAYLKELESANITEAKLAEITLFCEKELYNYSNKTASMEKEELVTYLQSKLNRPIRVCGMVKNVGEPGGGPFLVINEDGSISPQILESSQIFDKNLMLQATHFNPVDLVCGVRNYKGEKFNLTNYIDKNTGFISIKSKNGKELKALELPGLWNGAMSNWNSVFVEVPIETFNPVKTVNDLLRPEHQ